MARGHTLKRVGDEVARAPLRLGPRLLLELPDASREVVADELLAALEQVLLRIGERHPRDALQLCELIVLRLLQVLLELAEVRLSVGETLVAARELGQLRLDLLLLREDALLDLEDLVAPVGELRVDLRPQLDGLLAGLDLRLSPHRFGLALGVLDDLPAEAPRLADARRSEDADGEQGGRDPDGYADGNSDRDLHLAAPRAGGRLAALRQRRHVHPAWPAREPSRDARAGRPGLRNGSYLLPVRRSSARK